jgi:IS1 family transposase
MSALRPRIENLILNVPLAKIRLYGKDRCIPMSWSRKSWHSTNPIHNRLNIFTNFLFSKTQSSSFSLISHLPPSIVSLWRSIYSVAALITTLKCESLEDDRSQIRRHAYRPGRGFCHFSKSSLHVLPMCSFLPLLMVFLLIFLFSFFFA